MDVQENQDVAFPPQRIKAAVFWQCAVRRRFGASLGKHHARIEWSWSEAGAEVAVALEQFYCFLL